MWGQPPSAVRQAQPGKGAEHHNGVGESALKPPSSLHRDRSPSALCRSPTLQSRKYGLGIFCCASAPAAYAAPISTSSKATWPQSNQESFRVIKSLARLSTEPRLTFLWAHASASPGSAAPTAPAPTAEKAWRTSATRR